MAASNAFGVCRVITQAAYTVNTGDSTYLLEARDRKCLAIENKGNTTILVKFGSAIVNNEGISILVGAKYEPTNVPVNAVHIKSLSGTVVTAVVDGR